MTTLALVSLVVEAAPLPLCTVMIGQSRRSDG
jgi:hypothetical protein